MERRKTRVGSGRGGERGMETEPKTDTDNSAVCHGAVFSYILGRSNDERATETSPKYLLMSMPRVHTMD
jgi:hypothetical protein